MTQLIYSIFILIPYIWSKQINANYFNAKLFLVYLVSGICLAHLAFFNSPIKIIELPKALKYSFIFFILFALIYPLLLGNVAFILYSAKILVFLTITYYFYTTELLIPTYKKQKLQFVVCGLIALLCLFQIASIFDFRVLQNTLDHGRLLGTFGNVNMMSEFFVLTLPIIYLFRKHQDAIPANLKGILLSFWIFIIIYTRSRSSWLGLGLFLCFILVKHFNKKDFFYISFGFLLYFMCLIPTGQKDDGFSTVKKSSFAERLSLYKATSELIIDHPLGLGLGSFTNEIIPYRIHQEFKPNEFEYADQPHSEILKWGLQYGGLGLFIALSLLFYIFLTSWKKKNMLLISAILVLTPQILFQFPFENPASILVLAVYFSYWLTQNFSFTQTIVNAKIKTLFLLASLILIINSLFFIGSIITESQFSDDFTKTSFFCKYYPVNHRNCNYKNVHLINNNLMAAFRSDYKSEIDFSYLTADFQRILPIYFKRTNQENKLCESLLIYKMIYSSQRYFEQKDLDFCSKYKNPLEFTSPKQFRNDYRSWLEKSIF